MSTGWGRLGQALGGVDTSSAYEEGVMNSARMESALMRARKQRDELNALDEMSAEIGDMLGDEDLGRQFATILRAGKNPEQVTGGQLDIQRHGLTNDAATAGRAGNVDLMNILISAASGKPMVQNKVEGNTIISPYQEDANARPTDIGAALAGKYEAQGQKALMPPAPRASAAPKDPQARLNEQLAKEVISRYGKLMAREGADVGALTMQRDKELAKLGVGPLIAPGSDPATVAGLQELNSLPAGATPADAAAAFAGAATPGSSMEVEQVEDRKSVQGKMYVKINGTWYEE